jgi:hypothetical protein
MKTPFLLLLAIAPLALSGCGKPAAEREAEQEYFDRILARHEEVMALSDSARRMIDTVDIALRAAAGDPADSSGWISARQDLADGIAGMRGWMRSFRPPADDRSHRDALAALDSTSTALERIKDKLSATLASAAALRARQAHLSSNGAKTWRDSR